jgi:hypothetical protein
MIMYKVPARKTHVLEYPGHKRWVSMPLVVAFNSHSAWRGKAWNTRLVESGNTLCHEPF